MNVTVNNYATGTQNNFASDKATIHAIQNNTVDLNQLKQLLESVRKEARIGLSEEDSEAIQVNIEAIESELEQAIPRKGFLKTALSILQAVKGTVEFSVAVAALVQFCQPFL